MLCTWNNKWNSNPMYVKKIKNELKNVSLRHRAAKLYYLYKYIFIYKIGIALSSNFHILIFFKKIENNKDFNVIFH